MHLQHPGQEEEELTSIGELCRGAVSGYKHLRGAN